MEIPKCNLSVIFRQKAISEAESSFLFLCFPAHPLPLSYRQICKSQTFFLILPCYELQQTQLI